MSAPTPLPIRQRNILILAADDMGREQIEALGQGFSSPGYASLPNIAALASGGLTFNHFYTAAFCSPTRALLKTGRRAARTGLGNIVEDDEDQPLLEGEYTLAELIRDLRLGYRRAVFGKWHLGNSQDGGLKAPNFCGYDRSCITVRNLAADSGSFEGVWDASEMHGKAFYFFDYAVDGDARVNYGEYSSTWMADRAIDWVNSQGDNPWLCYVPFHAPHNPFHRPPSGHFNAAAWPCPNIQPTAQSGTSDLVQYFKASQEAMDYEIGRIVDSLPADVRSNTDIIFFSDNGTTSEALAYEFYPDGVAYNANHGKRSCYDPGIRNPLIWNGPQLAVGLRGTDTDQVVETTDLFATIASICAGSMSHVNRLLDIRDIAIDGYDLSAFLHDGEDGERVYALSEIFSPNGANAGTVPGHRSVQDARWKAYWRATTWSSGAPEFYDRDADPKELTNLTPGGDLSGLTSIQRAAYDAIIEYASDFYTSL